SGGNCKKPYSQRQVQFGGPCRFVGGVYVWPPLLARRETHSRRIRRDRQFGDASRRSNPRCRAKRGAERQGDRIIARGDRRGRVRLAATGGVGPVQTTCRARPVRQGLEQTG